MSVVKETIKGQNDQYSCITVYLQGRGCSTN